MHHEARGPVTLAELTSGLIWPRLFRAVGLSIQPSRVLVGFVMVAVMMGFGALFDGVVGRIVSLETLWMAAPMDMASLAAGAQGEDEMRFGLFQSLVTVMVSGLQLFVLGVLTLDLGQIGAALAIFFIGLPSILAEHWFGGAILTLVWIFIATLGGGAISRMAACEFSREVHMTAGQGLGYALARWKDLLLAVLAPAIFIAVLALGLMLYGGLLLRFPVVNIVGALLYGLALIVGFILVLLTLAFALGKAMLLPGVVVESTDWLDAIQRAYSYVLGRTIRFLIYVVVLLALGSVVYAIAATLTTATINGAAWLALHWAGESAREIAGGHTFFAMAMERPDAEGTFGVAAGIIGVWERLVIAVLAGFFVSFYFCASTLLYLAARRVNDEQDMDEIWMPGRIGGTAAPEESPEAPNSEGNDADDD
ncbi:MAG: hypothetical protein EA376_13550 [Phycisphaeraceae bacterium]|nr:MAG: hypothetical protein EA376_13550 [Phycisphaeraceae bacterium]